MVDTHVSHLEGYPPSYSFVGCTPINWNSPIACSHVMLLYVYMSGIIYCHEWILRESIYNNIHESVVLVLWKSCVTSTSMQWLMNMIIMP